MDGSVYDIPPVPRVGPPAPPLPSTISAEAAIESGLYSVPRALLNASEEGAQSLPPPPPNPFDIYDIPRASISPDLEDEEGIYDVPLDILDFEIYDYPPDVMELGLDPLDSGLDSTRNSTITVSSEFTVTPDRASSTISEDSWNTFSLPNSLRPSMAFSTFSMASSDDLQVSDAGQLVHTVCYYGNIYMHTRVRVHPIRLPKQMIMVNIAYPFSFLREDFKACRDSTSQCLYYLF